MNMEENPNEHSCLHEYHVIFCSFISLSLLESMIHDYHKHIVVWDNPVVGEDLLCESEVGNPHDIHTVAVKKVTDGN